MNEQTRIKHSKLDISDLVNYASLKDIQILRRIRGLYKLKNTLLRYQKKLILEGFKVINEYGLHVNINEVSDDYVDATRIMELSKIKYPSLYRKYKTLEKKFSERISNLEILLSE